MDEPLSRAEILHSLVQGTLVGSPVDGDERWGQHEFVLDPAFDDCWHFGGGDDGAKFKWHCCVVSVHRSV